MLPFVCRSDFLDIEMSLQDYRNVSGMMISFHDLCIVRCIAETGPLLGLVQNWLHDLTAYHVNVAVTETFQS